MHQYACMGVTSETCFKKTYNTSIELLILDNRKGIYDFVAERNEFRRSENIKVHKILPRM